MRYCMDQLDENSFIYGRPEDWVFIDWADDKEGAISEEQMLLGRHVRPGGNYLLGRIQAG